MLTIMSRAIPLLLAATPALAFGFFDNLEQGGGTVLPSPTAWGLAHGGLRALPSSGGAGLFANPADLPSDKALFFAASAAMATWDTSTQYEGFITPDRSCSGMTMGPATVVAGVGGRTLSYGLGISRVADMEYDGLVDVQDTTTTGVYFVEGIDRLVSSGALWEAVAGAALDPAENFRVGASAGIRFGGGEISWSHYTAGGQQPDSSSSVEWDESSLCWHGGFHLAMGSVLVAGSVDSGSDEHPWMFSGGAEVSLDMMGDAVAGLEACFASLDGSTDRNAKAFLETGSLFAEEGRLVFSIGMNEPDGYARSGLCGSIGHRLCFGDGALDMGILWRSADMEGPGLPVPFIAEDVVSAEYYTMGFSTLL